MLGSLIVYLKGMRIMMFQLSGYYCIDFAPMYFAPDVFSWQSIVLRVMV